MGVQGLFSYCLKNQKQCCTFVDLVEVAREQKGIEILVDYYCFANWVYDKFMTNLLNINKNKYLLLYGGEYSSLSLYVTALIKNLQSVDIHLTFLIDGARGSCKETTKRRLNTWLSRSQKDMRKIKNMLSVFYNEISIEDLLCDDIVRPVLRDMIFTSALTECGCKVVNCSGEADDMMAKQLLDSKAFAIFSYDSDFCLFKDCCCIPPKLFDIHNDMELEYCGEVPKKPLHLQIGLISTERVSHMFGLSSDELIELAIVCGNDLTSHYMRNNQTLLYKLDIRERKNQLENIVAWVKSYKRIENHPLLDNEMRNNSEFALAVQLSRSFYKLELVQDYDDNNKGSLTELVIERLKTKTLHPKMLGAHHGLYWQKVLFEDLYNYWPGIETLLSNLRSCIYRILLPLNEMGVIDYGWDQSLTIMPHTVSVAKWKWLPQFEEIKKENISHNLKIFHKIITQQEPGWKTQDWPRNYFIRYGRHNGFIFYCLRYFLLLNWQHNLFITEREFLTLICLLFTHKEEKQYQRYPLTPTSRCITINNWMQDIFHHAYGYLGTLLFLTEEFPRPATLFSGSTWVVYYWCFCSENSPAQLNSEQRKLFEETRHKLNDIIYEKRHMIKCLVDGVFPFDD